MPENESLFHDTTQGRTLTHMTIAGVSARFEFFDRFGSLLLQPDGAVVARHRDTGKEVPIQCFVLHQNFPVVDLGDRFIVVLGVRT